MKKLEDYIISIKDFPEEGILFRDITNVIENADGLQLAVNSFRDVLKEIDYDLIVGPEARGFIFGVPVAYAEKKGFVPVRKAGKLPRETVKKEYSLEYGKAAIEIHKDSIKKGQKVVIVDDLIATGGTIKAMVDLIHELGGEVVMCVFLIELKGLDGRKKLDGIRVESLISYEGA